MLSVETFLSLEKSDFSFFFSVLIKPLSMLGTFVFRNTHIDMDIDYMDVDVDVMCICVFLPGHISFLNDSQAIGHLPATFLS